jgi:hypothetical protein
MNVSVLTDDALRHSMTFGSAHEVGDELELKPNGAYLGLEAMVSCCMKLFVNTSKRRDRG